MPLYHDDGWKKYSLVNFMQMKLIKGDYTFEVDANKDNRTRGRGNKLLLKLPKSEHFKNPISYVEPVTGNSLSNECKNNLSPQTFKKNVKAFDWDRFTKRKSVK